MSLWCSLLGHRFEGAEVEREREERDEEVLTVTREVETCGRCGSRRVVAENTEVATVEPAPAHVTDDEPETSPDRGTVEPIEPRDPAAEDTEILEDDPERTPGAWPPEPGELDGGPDDSQSGDEGTGAAARDSPAASPGTLACPECGYATEAAGSSLRAGDSCPECRTGYLETT